MEQYQLRGNRVTFLEETHIKTIALNIANELKFTKRNRRRCDKVFESLSSIGVTLSVVDDNDWLGLTKGHFDHTTMTISVPNSIYEHACEGGRDALFVMLHELGHLFLVHRPLLHSSIEPATKQEDAEWQADTFADSILECMGYKTKQLTFDFYM